MNDLERDIAGAVAAHAQLMTTLTALHQDNVGEPSRLPGWTRGHVAAHIALNAESHARMLEAAARGERAVQYLGGAQQRAADIETTARLPAHGLRERIATSNDRLQAAWEAMPAGAWAGEGESLSGPVPLADLPFRRRREALVHLADVDLGYSWRDWPVDYVRLELPRLVMLWASRTPMGMSNLPAAALAVDERHRAAWLLGRADIDGLDPCTIFG
jgi:maleylpyruvate isomerase